jgi:septal ring factor EnvC (AmiA/AmiB activator)
MKINFENYLYQIDTMFKQKSKKDIYMVYIMTFGLIFAFSYLLFWESAENSFKQMKNKIASIEKKIKSDNRYLKYNPESKILKLDQEIKRSQTELIVFKDNNSYIKHKIESISSLIYDEQTWGEYLYSISKYAQKNSMKILDFTNKYALNKNSFGHVLDISIKTIGNYKNTLNFINSLEQSELVVDIHNLNIQTNQSLSTDLNISVWGLTY